MKKPSQLILSAAAALALASTAQAAYVNGDLLVGFTSAGAANDYVFDVGPLSGLLGTESWNLGADLGGNMTSAQFGAASWGVVGSLNTGQLVYSSAGSLGVPSQTPSTFTLIRANVQSIGSGSVSGSSVTPAQTTANSWFSQTDQALGTPGNFFFNNLDNPNVGTAAAAVLYSTDNVGDAAVLRGSFSISSDGSTLSWTAVPEPAVGSILAGFGLLALTFRRQLARKA